MGKSVLLAAVFVAILWGGGARAGCPANGQVFGVVEIGGKGIKATLSQIVSAPKFGPDSCDLNVLEELEPYNPDPVDSSKANQTLDDIGRQQDNLSEKAREHKVKLPRQNIFFVLSSGMESRAENSQLKAQIAKETGEEPGIISAEDESSLTFDGVASVDSCRDRRDDVLIDVGSSNTKGAYLIPDKNAPHCTWANPELQHVTFSIPWGTVTIRKEVGKRRHDESYVTTLDRFLSDEVVSDLAKVVDSGENGDRKGGFVDRRRVYMAGGIVYALATFARPQERGAAVELSVADIDAFYSDLKDRPACITQFLDESVSRAKCRLKSRLKLVRDEKTKKDVSDEIRDILQEIFPEREQLLAGAGLLKSLSDQWDFKHRKVSFMRQARHAWMLGYLMQKLGSRSDIPRQVLPSQPLPVTPRG